MKGFKLSAHSDQGQLVSVIKQVNPKAIALVHGEINALSALREKVFKDYPVTCPFNGQMLDGADKPEWVSPKTQEKLEKKEKLEVQITDTGVVLDEDIISSQCWKDFANGKHTATLKGERLIIRKT